MAQAKILRIYLDDIPRARAERGEFNIFNKIQSAFERQDFRVELRKNSEAERLKSATRRGYSLFHMDEPFHPRALTIRRAYFYPFWRIETSAKRWEWQIAKTEFNVEKIDAAAARQFCDRWRKTLFEEQKPGHAPDRYVYVPLQGRLLEQRSFQTASPLEMLRLLLLHEPDRRIVAGLHPREIYLQDEIDALSALIGANPRLQLSTEPMQDLLAQCDYVATENSAVALSGYFLHKPAVLFAQIDFHHIAANACVLGAEAAIKSAPRLTPDFDSYMFWFLRLTAINGGAPEVESQILETVRSHGWQI